MRAFSSVADEIMPFAAKTFPIVSNSERGRLFSRMSSSVCVTRSLSTAIE